MVAHDGDECAFGGAIEVGVGSVEVGVGEVVEVAGVGRGGPGAAEDFGVVDLKLQGGPAAAGVAVEKSAGWAGVHAVFGFEVGKELCC